MRRQTSDIPSRSEPDPQDPAPEGSSRRKRSDARSGRSSQRHSGGESKDSAATSSRRSHGSEGERERSHERHSHREGRSRDRGRAQRGDVRAAVLVLLADEPMHGYQLMHAIADRTEGAWRPSPGAIYPTIAQLAQENLVSVVAADGRKMVTLTDAGRDYLSANKDSLADPFTEITSQAGGTHDLRGSVEQLHSAARAVAKSGSDAQITRAYHVLSQARRDLYLILAETPADSPQGAIETVSPPA